MLQRLSIRGKILAVVAVPIIVLVLGAGLVVWNTINNVTRSQNAVQLMNVVSTGKEYAAAVRLESDAATNYVDAWVEHSDETKSRVDGLNRAMQDLETLAATDPLAAQAYSDLQSIFAGGQPISYVPEEGEDPLDGTAMSLEEARSVRPVPDEETGTLVWPEPDEVAQMSASYAAMAGAVNQYLATMPADAAATEIVRQAQTFILQEGIRATSLLTETPVYQERFLAAQPAVDETWARFSAAITDLPATASNATVVAILNDVQRSMSLLPERRTDIISRAVGPNPTSTYYHDITGNVSSAVSEIALVVDDPTLSRQLEAFGATDALINEMAVEDTAVDLILRAGAFAQGGATAIRTQFARTDFEREEAKAALANLNQGFDLPNLGASFDSGSQAAYQSVRNRVSDSTGLQLATAARQDWPTQVQEEVNVLYPFADDTLALANATAAQNQRDAIIQALVTVAASIVVVAASLILALLIARRIVNPLRRLTTTATAVRQELPRLVERVALPGERVDVSEVQIPVESADEVGRLAEAFNSVNAATLAIASEQAALRGSISEMFVNVARRDQVLLNRQLSSIDEMERTEDNPETLTKLFALDHLATRMRRNSESLLVLAGIDTGRRLRRPMPLSDVIRTASSEIELYERVQLELDADPAMVGHSALTAAHLFAELLENATVFSDPGTPVIVRTSAEANSFVVRISDSGIGMTPEELAEANSRVASSAASEILGAQRLGLFVVGRIARRIGARVEITSHEGEGTVATVYMPPSLFDLSAAPTDVAQANASTVDESVHAPSALVRHDMDEEVLDASSAVASAAERAGTPSLASYQPTVVAEGASLSGRGAASGGVAALVAADAANAPSVDEVDLDALTDGVSATGLPARRRGAKGKEAKRETDSIIGLPATATDAQLSALEADAGSGFTPVVSASEVSPQTAEQRAAMFRGFRSRREDDAEVATLAPDAESLGQAVRRGAAVRPEDVAGAAAIAAVELDEGDSVAGDSAATPAQDPLIRSGYDHDVDAAGAAVPASLGAMVIPSFEEDEPYEPAAVVPIEEAPVAPAAAPTAEPAAPAPVAGVESVSLADAPVVPAAPQAPVAPVAPAFAAAAVTSSPSLDELIQGGKESEVHGGFFSKLFRKSKNQPTAPSAATAMLASMPQAQPTGTGGIPIAPLDSGVYGAPAPVDGAHPGTDTVPIAAAYVPSADESDLASYTPSAGFRARPRDPWGNEDAGDALGLTPAAGAMPYNPGALGGQPPLYSRDDLARPLGWETAGESALAAAAPEQAAGYTPVVEVDPQPVFDEAELASAVFSEFSSLTSERPKVERTRAGLQKRVPVEVQPQAAQPAEEDLSLAHIDRNPDDVRTRFSSFYSGTQRARTDVEAFEKSTQGSALES